MLRVRMYALCGLLFGMAASLAAQPPGKPGKAGFNQYPQAKPAQGEAAPDFTLYDLEGKAYRLKDGVGKKPIVIEFGSYT